MEKWFYTGQRMPDGSPISIAARNEAQVREFLDKGYKPVSAKRNVRKKRTHPVRQGGGREEGI